MINLSTIKADGIFTYLFVVLALTIPGIGILNPINPDQTLKLDTYKLIVLSIFFSAPFFLIGILTTISIWDLLPQSKKVKEEEFTFMLISLYYIVTFLFSNAYTSTHKIPVPK